MRGYPHTFGPDKPDPERSGHCHVCLAEINKSLMPDVFCSWKCRKESIKVGRENGTWYGLRGGFHI